MPALALRALRASIAEGKKQSFSAVASSSAVGSGWGPHIPGVMPRSHTPYPPRGQKSQPPSGRTSHQPSCKTPQKGPARDHKYLSVAEKHAASMAAIERLRLSKMADTSNALLQVLETGMKAQPKVQLKVQSKAQPACTRPAAQVPAPNTPLSMPVAPAAPVPSPAYWKYNGELYPGEPGGLGLLALLHSQKQKKRGNKTYAIFPVVVVSTQKLHSTTNYGLQDL